MQPSRTLLHPPFKDVFGKRGCGRDAEDVFLMLKAHPVFAYERYSVYYIAWTPLGKGETHESW